MQRNPTHHGARTPKDLGYRWPAEWEPHAATWIAWPHNRETWPGRFDGIPKLFAQFVATLAQYEPVHILAGGEVVMAEAQSMAGHLGRVTLHDIATNDAWVRDYGPTFLLDATSTEAAIVDARFDAWGGKYPPWDLDNDVPRQLASRLGCSRFCPSLVLEGGSIDGNGLGSMLTTESCLLDPRRNAGLDRKAIEQLLADFYCVSEVVWLPGGPLAGDDTDGHIDQLARYVGPDRVVVAEEEDADDENYLPLQANLARLQAVRESRGRSLELVSLPTPRPIFCDGRRVPASYCNFYIANGCVLVPAFEDPADAIALDKLALLFPDREVIPLPARQLIWGLGSFHCLTQQQPAVGCAR